jgi:hypothetical protein
VISPILTNIYLDKLDRKLESLCQQCSHGKWRKQSPKYVTLMKQRKQLLEQGETNPMLRESLKDPCRDLNKRILQTPGYDYHDPNYSRVKFLRYADDVVIGVIGPRSLAEQIKEEWARYLKEDLKQGLNQQKTLITHLTTEKVQFLGYAFKTTGSRLRKRNLKRQGLPYNVIQTSKTGSGNITLVVPLKKLSKKLEKYMENGQPACMDGLVNQPVDHIIEHYNALIRGWYNYYQLAENVSSLNYARYVLQYSLAKTLARKERSTVSKIFQKYGKNLTFKKPNGREVSFFNQPLKQVKKARASAANLDTEPLWGPRRTQTRLLDSCTICNNQENVEMHHVRHIRKRGKRVRGFTLYLAAINRKQIPVCRKCHDNIHHGQYDGASLSTLLEKLQAPKTGI